MNGIVNLAEALNRATVIVDREAGPSETRYTLTGERGAVESAVNRLLRQYPSDGYGTRATYTETGAVVTRSNSCD